MNLKNKNIAEGMRVTNGKNELKVVSWDKSYNDCLLKYLDSKGNRYVIAEHYELSGTEKDPQISWMNGRYFTANSDDEALEEYLDYLGEVNEYDISESLKKKSIKEEINRSTWGRWVVKNVHHIEYFFNGNFVNEKTLQSLFDSEGFDTDVATVENEIKKAVRSYKLENLDGTALHIAHNSVGNRIDLVFNVGGLIGDVESLSKAIDECVIRINGDIYEQGEDMWNFGFAIYLTCDIYPMDLALAESKKKSRKSLKESAKPINEKNVAKFVDELNKWVDKIINYADENAIDFTKKYGKLYSFDYVMDSDGTIRVYDEEGTLDWWDGGRVVEFIKNRANGYGWYAEACSGDSDFCFGEL